MRSPEIISAHFRASSSAVRAAGLSGTLAIFNNSWIASGGQFHPSLMTRFRYFFEPVSPKLERPSFFGGVIVVSVNAERDASLCCGPMVSDMPKDDWRHAEPGHARDRGPAQIVR